MKSKAPRMLGGAGNDTITPETFRNKGTGVVRTGFGLFRSQGCPSPLN